MRLCIIDELNMGDKMKFFSTFSNLISMPSKWHGKIFLPVMFVLGWAIQSEAASLSESDYGHFSNVPDTAVLGVYASIRWSPGVGTDDQFKPLWSALTNLPSPRQMSRDATRALFVVSLEPSTDARVTVESFELLPRKIVAGSYTKDVLAVEISHRIGTCGEMKLSRSAHVIALHFNNMISTGREIQEKHRYFKVDGCSDCKHCSSTELEPASINSDETNVPYRVIYEDPLAFTPSQSPFGGLVSTSKKSALLLKSLELTGGKSISPNEIGVSFVTGDIEYGTRVRITGVTLDSSQRIRVYVRSLDCSSGEDAEAANSATVGIKRSDLLDLGVKSLNSNPIFVVEHTYNCDID